MAGIRYKIKCTRCGEFVMNNEVLMRMTAPRCKDEKQCSNNIKIKEALEDLSKSKK